MVGYIFKNFFYKINKIPNDPLFMMIERNLYCRKGKNLQGCLFILFISKLSFYSLFQKIFYLVWNFWLRLIIGIRDCLTHRKSTEILYASVCLILSFFTDIVFISYVRTPLPPPQKISLHTNKNIFLLDSI